MRIRMRIIAIVVTVIAATFIGAGVGSAHTAAGMSDCPAGNVCIWEHRDFAGTMLVIPAGVSYASLHDLTCVNCVSSHHHRSNGTWGDMMSSWFNNSSIEYCWYFHIDYQTALYPPMRPGGSLNYVGSANNDEASAIQPCSL